jgi:hypothetical protein
MGGIDGSKQSGNLLGALANPLAFRFRTRLVEDLDPLAGLAMDGDALLISKVDAGGIDDAMGLSSPLALDAVELSFPRPVAGFAATTAGLGELIAPLFSTGRGSAGRLGGSSMGSLGGLRQLISNSEIISSNCRILFSFPLLPKMRQTARSFACALVTFDSKFPKYNRIAQARCMSNGAASLGGACKYDSTFSSNG